MGPKLTTFLRLSLIPLLLCTYSCSENKTQLSNNSISFLQNFYVKYGNTSYKVLVDKPNVTMEKYPLIIYHHGEYDTNLEEYQLDRVARTLAKAGFLVWIPERPLVEGADSFALLKQAETISNVILRIAQNVSAVDKKNINIVGYSLGSLAVFGANLDSNVNSIVLIGFGAPYEDMALYEYAYYLSDSANYNVVHTRILIVEAADDSKVSLEPAEIARRKMVAANKSISCIEYAGAEHQSLSGDKAYLQDVIKYLHGEKINTTDHLESDMEIFNKWQRIRETGYW